MKDKFKYVLVAILAILSVFFMYLNKDKISNSDSNINKVKENKNEMTETEKGQAITNSNNFIRDNLAYLFTYFDHSYENLNDMDNQDKLWIAYWILKDDYNLKYMTDYTSDEILVEMQKLFGGNFNIVFEDIKDYEGNSMYDYNEKNKKYEYVGGGFGASVLHLVRNDFVSIEKENGKYYITYAPLFYYVDGFMDVGTVSIMDINYNKITTYEIKDYNDEVEVTNEEFNRVKDKITNITYIFENENDQFVLTGMKFKEQ